MKEEVRNPRLITVEFKMEVANALRDFSSMTGTPLTRVINNAVEAYMLSIRKLTDAVSEPRVTPENLSNIGTNVDFDELYDSLFRECFEVTHIRTDFVPTNKFKGIISKAINKNSMYWNAGISYDSQFRDFLKRRYGIVQIQSRKHSRMRGYEGVLVKPHKEVF